MLTKPACLVLQLIGLIFLAVGYVKDSYGLVAAGVAVLLIGSWQIRKRLKAK